MPIRKREELMTYSPTCASTAPPADTKNSNLLNARRDKIVPRAELVPEEKSAAGGDDANRSIPPTHFLFVFQSSGCLLATF